MKSTEKEIREEALSYLQPKNTLQIKGRLCYKERVGAWNILHLRKEILTLFPELRQKRQNCGYTMFYSKEPKETKKLLEKLEKEGLVPILLLLGKVKEFKE